MTTLYEITGEYQALQDALIAAETDDDRKLLAARLIALDGDFRDKCRQIARLIKNDMAEAEALRAEEKRLAARRQAAQGRVEYWQQYVLSQMQQMRLPAVDDPVLPVRRVLNPPRVEVTVDPHTLPPDLIQEALVVTPDLRAIKAALEAGREVEGCSLTRSERLKIG